MSGRAMRREHAEVSLVALVALLLACPIVSGRLLAGHDVATYLMYAQQVAAGAREGVLLPAWAADLNGGYGGPGLLLYPPFVNVLHAIPLAAGLPAPFALGAVSVLGLFLSGLSARWWLRAEGWSAAALPAALVYMAAPYRMLDLYERTNLSEHWAFVFPPLILAAAAVRASRPARVLLTAAGVAGLLVTNTPLALLFSLLFAVWFVAPGGLGSRRPEVLGGAALGAALAAFLLVPQALSSRWVVTELWYGPAAKGFGPAANTLFSAAALDRPFNLRVSAVILGTALLAGAAYFSSRGGESRSRLFWGAAALVALALTLPPSGALWEAVPLVARVQFPWRLGAVSTLALAALLARAARPGAAWTVFCLAAAGSLPLIGASTTTVEEAFPPSARTVAPCTTAPNPEAVAQAWGEARNAWMRNPQLRDVWYVPRTAAPGLVGEVFGDAPAVYPAFRERAAVVPAEPGAPVYPVLCGPLDREVDVLLAAPSGVVLRTFLLPGIEGRLDGRPAPARQDPRSGLLSVEAPAGAHRVGWRWRAPAPVVAGRWISVVSLVVSAALGLAAARRPAAAPRS